MKTREKIEIILNIANASKKLDAPHDWFVTFTDIAQMAIDALARVEELEKEVEDLGNDLQFYRGPMR